MQVAMCSAQQRLASTLNFHQFNYLERLGTSLHVIRLQLLQTVYVKLHGHEIHIVNNLLKVTRSVSG